MWRCCWWLVAAAAVLASCGGGDAVRPGPGAGAIRAPGAIRHVADANQPVTPGDPAFAANIAIGKKYIEALYARRSSNAQTPGTAPAQQPFCAVPAGSSFTDCYFFALNDSVNVGISATLPTSQSPTNYVVEDPTHSGEAMRTYVNDYSDPNGKPGSTFQLAYDAGYVPATVADNASLPFPSGTPLPEYDVYAASRQSNYSGTLTLKALNTPPSNIVNGTCQVVDDAEANIIPQVGNAQGGFFDLDPQIETYLVSPPCAPAIAITAASLSINQITVLLSGAGSGDVVLTEKINGQSVTRDLGVHSSGVLSIHYFNNSDASDLTPGEHTALGVTWSVATGKVSTTRAESFNVLGLWQHTQYNIPSQSNCTGATETVALYSGNCSASAGTFKVSFANQAHINGSGLVDTRDCSYDSRCGNSTNPTDFDFPITPMTACGTVPNNSTVAVSGVHGGGTWTCGDQALEIRGTAASEISLKQVDDNCPACNNSQSGGHMDNFTTTGACYGVPSLPNAVTVRMR